jgi:hypothetical protein
MGSQLDTSPLEVSDSLMLIKHVGDESSPLGWVGGERRVSPFGIDTPLSQIHHLCKGGRVLAFGISPLPHITQSTRPRL